MWETQRSADGEWTPWEMAGPYWHRLMRQFAEVTIAVLEIEG
ncbi:hypothetical protein [Sphingobium sp. SCG-1]|nr:hypothetical protein [Sphingobium sp. SCG-1]